MVSATTEQIWLVLPPIIQRLVCFSLPTTFQETGWNESSQRGQLKDTNSVFKYKCQILLY